MDTISTLKHGGLSGKEAAVYLAALELGEAAMTELARKAGLKRPTVYLVVEELLGLGLLSATTKGRRKTYSAANPSRLVELTKFRAREVEGALPELQALYNVPKQKPRIQVFEGAPGLKALYREIYWTLREQKEEALWFTRIDALRQYLPDSLTEFKRMLREIKHPRIRELNYGNDAGVAWEQETRRLRGRNHFVRLLPKSYEFGFSDSLIFANKLVIFSLKRDVFVITIESEDVAKTYRALFNWAWTQGRESK